MGYRCINNWAENLKIEIWGSWFKRSTYIREIRGASSLRYSLMTVIYWTLKIHKLMSLSTSLKFLYHCMRTTSRNLLWFFQTLKYIFTNTICCCCNFTRKKAWVAPSLACYSAAYSIARKVLGLPIIFFLFGNCLLLGSHNQSRNFWTTLSIEGSLWKIM